jgi:O-acetyl-ADP-ribose deacetylase (regulator of RNase III)
MSHQLPIERTFNGTRVCLLRGDITHQTVDAIVNAANSELMGGGGVDGAIHRAGGREILEECKVIRKTQGKCAAGDAVITGAGKLKARHVVHTVGPVWHGGKSNEEETLASAYRTSLQLAEQNGDRTIAFPSISTGVYRYPIDLAAAVALRTVAQHCAAGGRFSEIRFVLFDDKTFNAFQKALADLPA